MTEPNAQRPVPGPPRPAPAAPVAAPTAPAPAAAPTAAGEDGAADRFADLPQRPVGEHVAVYEAEHERLQRELGTIDQL